MPEAWRREFAEAVVGRLADELWGAVSVLEWLASMDDPDKPRLAGQMPDEPGVER